MMMMAGGEGTSAAEVGVKTRSSSSRRSSTTQSQQSNRRGREPVSGNNPRVKATSKNHDQAEPTSIDQDEEECENTNDNEDEDPHDPDQSRMPLLLFSPLFSLLFRYKAWSFCGQVKKH